MKKLTILLLLISTLLYSQDLVGKKYNDGFVLKNEVVYIKNDILKQDNFFSTNNLTNTNNFYDGFDKKDDYLCPVKNVKIGKYKKWLGFIEFDNGDILAISSPKYTFFYYNKNKNSSNITNVYVTDFNSGSIIDAKMAFYVFGSKIASIGGDDVVPFEKESEAMEFLEKNSGKKIYKFDRMDEKFIDYLEMR